jgi:MerR family transcriptional regulator, thiopeptide resistance regulator
VSAGKRNLLRLGTLLLTLTLRQGRRWFWGVMSRLYKASEFAGLAGVTVRALHHYDRIGLLKPLRSSSGYRLYSLADLERLEQITALKFLGIPLGEIKILLQSSPLTLGESLDLQRRALTEKRDIITRAIHAIEAAEELVRSGKGTDASVLRKIIEVIEMHPEENFIRKYYTEEAWARRSHIMEEIPPETREHRRDAWRQLFLNVESALELDPASEKAQILTRQWVLLVEAGTGGDSGIKAAAIKAWKDHRSWPLDAQDALIVRYGLVAGNDRNASMERVEKVAKFIGQAIGRKYYGALEVTRRALINRSLADRSSERWVDLFRDVEASLAEDPASEKAQALAVEWTELTGDTEDHRTAPQPEDFQAVLQQKSPLEASVAVINQVARLYRIEQVSSFLAKALACGEDKRRPNS